MGILSPQKVGSRKNLLWDWGSRWMQGRRLWIEGCREWRAFLPRGISMNLSITGGDQKEIIGIRGEEIFRIKAK